MDLKTKIDQIETLKVQDFCEIIQNLDDDLLAYAQEKARILTEQIFNKKIYYRGLIEFTNHCKNNCYYCGIRADNKNIKRYRMSKDEILKACEHGYEFGCRTFVLQGGEDAYFTDEILCDIVSEIKNKYPDCAITLSVGERTFDSYKKLFNAGADRYLLRQETANCELYSKIHPRNMSHKNRIECLQNLKKIGYQTGCGMMIGVPGQTDTDIAKDLMFIKEFKPAMVGVGPFIPQKDTPYHDKDKGSIKLTLLVVSLIRLLLPNAMIPSTTALASAGTDGRIQGILSGANVVMPNITPAKYRDNYALYDTKKTLNDDIEHVLEGLNTNLSKYGYSTVISKGDAIEF